MSLLCIHIPIYMCVPLCDHCLPMWACTIHYNIVNKVIPKLLVSLLQPQATVQAIQDCRSVAATVGERPSFGSLMPLWLVGGSSLYYCIKYNELLSLVNLMSVSLK
jgi:hypothetical protein